MELLVFTNEDWLYTRVRTLCEILVPVGNSTWLLGQILVLSVPNTVMYYKLVTSISLEPSRAELK